MLNPTQAYDAHIEKRLRAEPIIWFGTSGRRGQPHMVPMWFLWDGATITLFSLPNTRKLRDLANNSEVVLALEAADLGYDVVILEGRATLLNDPSVTGLMSPFVAKYANIPRRWTSEEWAKRFAQSIRVVPTKLTAWMTKPGSTPQNRSLSFE
jgi:PPOX class probable F420-dependent enzyme